MLVALGAIDPGSNPGRPTTSCHASTTSGTRDTFRTPSLPSERSRWTRHVQGEYPPTADMGLGDRWIRFVVGLMGKNLEETEEEKAERVAAEAEKRIAEAKRKDM